MDTNYFRQQDAAFILPRIAALVTKNQEVYDARASLKSHMKSKFRKIKFDTAGRKGIKDFTSLPDFSHSIDRALEEIHTKAGDISTSPRLEKKQTSSQPFSKCSQMLHFVQSFKMKRLKSPQEPQK